MSCVGAVRGWVGERKGESQGAWAPKALTIDAFGALATLTHERR